MIIRSGGFALLMLSFALIGNTTAASASNCRGYTENGALYQTCGPDDSTQESDDPPPVTSEQLNADFKRALQQNASPAHAAKQCTEVAGAQHARCLKSEQYQQTVPDQIIYMNSFTGPNAGKKLSQEEMTEYLGNYCNMAERTFGQERFLQLGCNSIAAAMKGAYAHPPPVAQSASGNALDRIGRNMNRYDCDGSGAGSAICVKLQAELSKLSPITPSGVAGPTARTPRSARTKTAPSAAAGKCTLVDDRGRPCLTASKYGPTVRSGWTYYGFNLHNSCGYPVAASMQAPGGWKGLVHVQPNSDDKISCYDTDAANDKRRCGGIGTLTAKCN